VNLPGKKTELNAKLEALLGLSSDEFSKIVVLPQGDFQQFLEATSGQREAMLEKLFPVEAYDRLTERLKVQAGALQTRRDALEDRLTALNGQREGADRAAVESALPAAQEALAEAETAAQNLQNDVVRAQEQRRDWERLASRRNELRTLSARAAEIDALRETLERAAAARPHWGVLERRTRIHADGTQARAAQDALKRDLTAVDRAFAAWTSRRPQTQARETRLAEIQKTLGALELLLPAWREAQTLRAQHAAAQNAAEEAQRTLDGARSSRRSCQAARVALIEAEAAQAANALISAGTARDEAEREFTYWSELLSHLQAAALAQTLAEGTPCPVCGSVHHPSPARHEQVQAETPDRHRAAAEALRQARSAYDRAQERSDRARADADAAHAQFPDIEAVQAPRRTRADVEAELASAVKREDEALVRWTETDRALHGLSSRLGALPPETTGDSPEAEKTRLEAEAAQLREEQDRDRREQTELERERAGLTARVAEAETQLEAQRREFAELTAQLTQALEPLGWSIDDLKIHRLGEDETRAAQTAVQTFDRERDRLTGETEALEARFPQGEPVALAPLEAAAATARALRDERAQTLKELEFRLRDLDRWEEEIRELRRQTAELDAEFQIVVPLAKALDGGNAHKLRLKTYVLVQYLDQVARAATLRLEAMSGGRYALAVQTQGTDSRTSWGLDLAVRDAFTGQERAVGTLSGGEKFMTSIALALGLADVIQERSGGVKLEAIFIDEGFGTLDDQSLDQAMKILQTLGHRSVGVISHVAELRQRITSRVEVSKGKNGSTLKVV